MEREVVVREAVLSTALAHAAGCAPACGSTGRPGHAGAVRRG
jgi:hypothetical protein